MWFERFDLSTAEGLHGCRRWVSDRAAVTVGQLLDGRHFAHHSRKGLAFVSAIERDACDLADRWLARGLWRPDEQVIRSPDQPV